MPNGFVWKTLLHLRWYHKNKFIAMKKVNVEIFKGDEGGGKPGSECLVRQEHMYRPEHLV